MGKISTLAIAALIAGSAIEASAIEVTLNVDDASRVKCTVGYSGDERTLVNGENKLDVSEYSQISLTSTEGNIMKLVTNGQGTTQTSWNTYWSVYISGYESSYVYNITTGSLAELRTGSCTLNIDNPSKANIQYNGTSMSVSGLEAGANTLKFIPGVETMLYVTGSEYNVPLYAVTVDGTAARKDGNTYYVDLSDGISIDVQAEFPDIQVPVTFSYVNDGAGFVSGVKVDGQVVDNYNDANFTVKAGSKLEIEGNTSDYQFNKLTINGQEVSYFYSPYSTVITEATSISIDATKYATISATIDIDNPSRVTVYKGSEWSGQTFDLVPGENTVTVRSSDPSVIVAAKSGYLITSVTIDGAEQNAVGGKYYFSLTEGMHVVISTDEIRRDETAEVYVNNKAAAIYGFTFQRSDRSDITVEDGYNEVKFNALDVPFYMSSYGQNSIAVYVNNEEVSPYYEGGSSYEIGGLTNGSVIKVYLDETPTLYNVNVSAGEGVGELTCTNDRIQHFAAADGIMAFPNTEISIASAEGQRILVKVNDEEIEGVEGVYTFTTGSEASDVYVSLDPGTGIAGVSGDASAQTVYNLQGIVVKRNATELNELPAGIYIIGGKKVVKK